MARAKKGKPKKAKLSFRDQTMIGYYLSYLEVESDAGYRSAMAAKRISPDTPGMDGQVAYWRCVSAAMRWATSRLSDHQPWLPTSGIEPYGSETQG